MQDREILKDESKTEYIRDRTLVDNIVQKIMQEDLNVILEDKRKKEIARNQMYSAYQEKEERMKQQKENERLEKERQRKYFEQVEKRDNEQKALKAVG
jgi:hypothetical protein